MRTVNFKSIQLQIPSRDEGADLISYDDFGSFIPHLTQMDMEIRMKKSLQNKNVSENLRLYLEFIRNEVLEFTTLEIKRLSNCFAEIDTMLQSLRFNLSPSLICVIKTTGSEEGGAGYTRNHCIIIPKSKFKCSDFHLKEFFAHELFHVFSRYNPRIRFQLYSLLGFVRNENIRLTSQLNSRRITNPDAADFRFTITLADRNGSIKTCVPIVFSKYKNFDPAGSKNMFDYVDFKYFILNDDNILRLSKNIEVKRINGLYEINVENKKNNGTELYQHPLYEKITRNSGYIIHPEEILADNFSLLLLSSQNSSLLKGITSLGKDLQHDILTTLLR